MATELPRESSSPAEIRYRKPRPDLYTALLVIALVALIVGCVMLYLELDMFEFKYQGAPSVSWLHPATLGGPVPFSHPESLISSWSTDARATGPLLPV